MALVSAIDLTSSPEPDGSPNKIASAALAQFRPSKERINRVAGPPRHDHRAYGDAAVGSFHVTPSYQAQSVRRLNQGNNRSTTAPEWSQPLHQKPFRPEQFVSRGSNVSTTTGTQRWPAQESSLAWLLQQESQKSSGHVRQTLAAPISRPQSSAQDRHQWRKENGVSSELKRSAVNLNAKPPVRAHVPDKARLVSPLPNANAVRVSHNQPVTSSPLIHTRASVAPQSLKRPAPVPQVEVVPTSNKRNRISAEKPEGNVQDSAWEHTPSRTHKTRLVDVTDNTLEERAALNDDAHDWHVQSGKAAVSNHGIPYSIEEDGLLRRLKEVNQLSWDEIVPHFNGRTRGSLQVRYSTKLASKPSTAVHRPSGRTTGSKDCPDVVKSQSPDPTSRPKRRRKQTASAVDGLISWSEVIAARKTKGVVQEHESEEPAVCDAGPLAKQDRVFPNTMSRLLRQRELGRGGGRAWQSHPGSMSDEMREHVCSKYTLSHCYQGTSGDVLSVSWSPDGTRFAAGSAAISDSTSMQYNMSRNLLLGDVGQEELRELVEHHEPRPVIYDSRNINASHAMRETQDSRLFVTVTATRFSRDGTKLFTAGKDRKLRVYSSERSLNEVRCLHEVDHGAAVDLLSINNDELVATGCHRPNESINVYDCRGSDSEHKASLSPIQAETSALPLYPSSLKWGIASQHRNFLLAGFCNDINTPEHEQSGTTCVWDMHVGQRIPLKGLTCNVFDVAWNPLPTSTSSAFAVASSPSGTAVNKGMRSVVQLFAPNQDALRRVLLWQCPALDINDIMFCPHDANLLACGATDGKVYVWDQRFADRSQKPLHVLEHGESLTVLPADVDRELIDTGVRFLSWGSTKTRLYSGSSDGVVKVWNPYRSPHNTEVEEFTTPRQQRSAIMAGAFNSDTSSLLMGTEVGQINLFSIGRQAHGRQARRWKMHTAPSPLEQTTDVHAETKASLDSGKIEFRPCGALPIRQAVQGRNYDGPFAASTMDMQQARDAYQMALDTQNQLHLSADVDQAGLEKAAIRVKDALAALTDQEHRLEFYQACRPKADAFQRSLLAAASHRLLLRSALGDSQEPCRLDCGYFEAAEENAADSRASELRIPGFHRWVHGSTVTERADEDSAGSTDADTICPSCHPFSKSRKGRVRCRQCRLKHAGLTATCTKCSAPARPAMSSTGKSICAKCEFACFRCGQSAAVSLGVGLVHCAACDLTWEAGVLGYELMTGPTGRGLTTPVKERGQIRDDDEFGNPEIEHYASHWEVKMPHE